MSQAQVPQVAADYFGCGTNPHFEDHPVVVEAYYPERGWVSQRGYRKRVSHHWVRKLRNEGATVLALEHAGRVADFRATELTWKTGLRG